MSPIALAMNLILAILLLAALGFGLRLERRLKALRDSQASFAGAVADLDRAAQRAEHGLAELRAATDETIELLAGRIEKARALATRLESLTAEGARPSARADAPRLVTAPDRSAPRSPRPAADLPNDRAEAAAEDLVLRLAEKQIASEARTARPEPRPSVRSRASIDDELFDAAPRTALGTRR
jgi:hypothetical protein